MRKRIGFHVRQNVVAYIALFFALTGGAVAAGANLKEGDPAGGDLTGTYPNPTIVAGAVTGGTGGKVADDTLTGADIDEASLGKVPSAATADSAPVSGLERVVVGSAANSDSPKRVTASCPAGKKAVGTGADIFAPLTGSLPNLQTDVVIDQIAPASDLSSVEVVAVEEEPTNNGWGVTAIAICANAS